MNLLSKIKSILLRCKSFFSINKKEKNSFIAQSMVVPLRRALEYNSVGRKLFMVEPLPQGAYATYTDTRTAAYRASASASVTYTTSEPEYVGTFPIRQDITVLPADNPRGLRLGWRIYEGNGDIGITYLAGNETIRRRNHTLNKKGMWIRTIRT